MLRKCLEVLSQTKALLHPPNPSNAGSSARGEEATQANRSLPLPPDTDSSTVSWVQLIGYLVSAAPDRRPEVMAVSDHANQAA